MIILRRDSRNLVVVVCFVLLGFIFLVANLNAMRDFLPKLEFANLAMDTVAKNTDINNTMKLLRKRDMDKVQAFLKMNLDSLTEEAAKDRVYGLVAEPTQGVCRTMKRFGGIWVSIGSIHGFDGDKFYCIDAFRHQTECLIYSFGIKDDWSFEDLVDSLGCSVYAYDPTTTAPTKRGKSIQFAKMGISSSKNSNYDTLGNFIKMNNHTGIKISYLKVDVEGEELNVLEQWIQDGILLQVDQLGMELHLTPESKFAKGYKWLLNIFQELYKIHFRLISYEANIIPGKDSTGYTNYFEVVLMKDNIWDYLDKEPYLVKSRA